MSVMMTIMEYLFLAEFILVTKFHFFFFLVQICVLPWPLRLFEPARDKFFTVYRRVKGTDFLQVIGSYLLYSWLKLKLLSVMGQLFISSHPIPLKFSCESTFSIVWTSGYCISLSWGKQNIQKQRMTYAHPQAAKCRFTYSVNNEEHQKEKNVWAFEW